MRSILIYFCSILAAFPLWADSINLPDIGDSAGEVSPDQEYRTGRAVMRNLYRAGQLVDDPLTEEYLNSLGYKLVAASPKPEQTFQFFTVNDNSINAFALPGGFIGINYGLLLSTNFESELAAVMAHEIAHVTQRHHARQYMAPSNNIPVVAALIAAMIMGGKDHQVAEAALATMAAKSVQDQINFTRSNEQEADRIGIDILFHARFDPHSMPSFFEVMDKNSRLYGDSIPEFLRTHPVHPSRIADSQNRANQYTKRLVADDKNYLLTRTRLHVLSNKDKKALLTHYESVLQTGRHADREAARYGYTLALMKNAQHDQARQQLKRLLKSEPQRIAYLLLAAQLEEASGNLQAALNKYQAVLTQYPGHEATIRYYSKALLNNNEASKAKITLEKIIKNNGNHPQIFRLLADIETQLGKPASAHEAMANYYYHAGQTHEAITQLSLALKQSDIDFYQSSRIDAQKKSMEDELLLLEEKQPDKP